MHGQQNINKRLEHSVGSFVKSRKASIDFVISVCPVLPSACNNPAPTGEIFIEFDIWGFFEIFFQKIQVSLKSDKNNGTLHGDQYTFLIISHPVPLRMRNISDKICRESRNTHFISNNFIPKVLPFMRMWERVFKPARPQITIQGIRPTCRISKATDSHSCYEILIVFHRALMLRYMYSAVRVNLLKPTG